MKNKILSLLSVSIAFGITACSSTQEQFDFSKRAPDEFAVVTRAPLEMPPNYTLRPPRPGAQRPQEATPDNEAKQAIFGANTNQVKKEIKPVSDGESILLQKTGATAIQPNIRDVVDSETAEISKKETPTIDRILGKAGRKVDAPATIVDPIKESERIIQNKEQGKSVTDGETPTITQ